MCCPWVLALERRELAQMESTWATRRIYSTLSLFKLLHESTRGVDEGQPEIVVLLIVLSLGPGNCEKRTSPNGINSGHMQN